MSPRAVKSVASIALFLVAAALAPDAQASCVVHRRTEPNVVASNIFFNLIGFGSTKAERFRTGVLQWNGCNTAGDIPTMLTSNPGSDYRQINVRIRDGFNPDNNQGCAKLEGISMDLYEFARNNNNELVSCLRSDIFTDTAAHEAGHAMGFTHPTCPSCATHIMANAAVVNGNYTNRSVQPAECEMAAAMNTTIREMNDTQADNDIYNSPILVDLDRNQFHLSEQPVWFDIDADGQAELTTWTSSDQQDAFLCWDRDGNAAIDSGEELFGDSTRLLSGVKAAHGYLALAELDSAELGGNGDGVIDDGDAHYSSLCLWLDANQDGVSGASELFSLADKGVVKIETEFRSLQRHDQFGNLFLFAGWAWREESGHLKRISTSDVFLVEME